ncbi:uncharacterized protein EAF02_001366 [Botrytis sinoallii]|uniref:uncharacterized protein n=1 Tax=Botrytis sinoallii TaxID=1463999 RepID=UPI001901DFC0|nr:uncharacterized protein EAF02_001366 [Botrytis sinoallii]KAF7891041.1 hypothetical protein EAF02_001366 [Botrytis sinoallii]
MLFNFDGHTTETALDISYYNTRVPEYKEEWNSNNCYYVSTMDIKSLSYVDTPKTDPNLVTHISERQWNLPRNHPHRLLNFPQEVLDLILGFTLVIKDHTITPDVTSSNKRNSYKMSQSYTLDGKRYKSGKRYKPPNFCNIDHPVPLSTIITKKHHDSEGAYFMLHKVYRSMIDATILRVCKAISVQGTKMLYEKNTFQFSMTQVTTTACPGYLVSGKVHKPRVVLKHRKRKQLDYIPIPDMPNHNGYLPMAFRAIETQSSLFDLEEYLYHDHFIRFLRVIGPAKAAMIKKLHFHGIIVTHECQGPDLLRNPAQNRQDVHFKCEDDLYDSLFLYIPLINKFCTSLQTMVIGIGEDKMYMPSCLIQSQTIIRFEALDELLKTLKTVRRLEIYQLKEADPNYFIVEIGSNRIAHTFPELYSRRVVELERKVTRWFKKRADKWEHEEIERQKTLMTLETPPQIGEE